MIRLAVGAVLVLTVKSGIRVLAIVTGFLRVVLVGGLGRTLGGVTIV